MNYNSQEENPEVAELLRNLEDTTWMHEIQSDMDSCVEAVEKLTAAMPIAVKASSQLKLMKGSARVAEFYRSHFTNFENEQARALSVLQDIIDGQASTPTHQSIGHSETGALPWGTPQIGSDALDLDGEGSYGPPF